MRGRQNKAEEEERKGRKKAATHIARLETELVPQSIGETLASSLEFLAGHFLPGWRIDCGYFVIRYVCAEVRCEVVLLGEPGVDHTTTMNSTTTTHCSCYSRHTRTGHASGREARDPTVGSSALWA